MSKTLALLGPAGTLLLAACGQTSQPTAAFKSPSQAANSQAVTSGAVGVVHPFDASDLAAAKPTGQLCSLDSDFRVTVGKPYVFKGWLLGPSRHPAGAFTLIMRGNQDFGISSTTGASRPDVGKYLNDPALAAAGFEFTATLTTVPPGKYEVQLLIKPGSNAYVCDTGRTLIVAK